MPDSFDPYHIWLSIPPEEQPPNHYRLLGIAPFEANPDAIESAADRQMTHLRTFQSGPHARISQRLLNAVSSAKLCLLDSQKKAAYDEQLRGKMAARAPAATPTYQGQTLRTAVLLSEPAANVAGAPEPQPRKPSLGAGTAVVRGRPKMLWFMLAPLASVLLVVGVCIWISGHSDEEPKPPQPAEPQESVLVFDWSPADRSGVTLAIDDARVVIPAAGAWEYSCPAGRHHIVAQRPAFKPLDKTVAATAGGRQTIPVTWQPQATLALDWPPGDRSGAQVKIDGQLQADIQREPWELPVEPGKHSVSVTWPDAPPFESEVIVSADSRQLVAIPAHAESRQPVAIPSVAIPPQANGKLWVRWPPGDRKGGKLKIDGQIRHVPGTGPIKFDVKPGQHKVYATRPSLNKPYIDEVVTVAPGKETQVNSGSVGEPPQVATHESGSNPKSKRGVAKEASEKRPEPKQPVPSPAEQQRVAKDVEQLYKTGQSGTNDQLSARAKELFTLANQTKTSSIERYVLLNKGVELAAKGGDLALALQGIDILAAGFEIDPFDAKQKLLDKLAKIATSPELITDLVAAAESVATEAIAADRYDVAAGAIAAAVQASAKKGAGTLEERRETQKALANCRVEISALQEIWKVTQAAQGALENVPDDGDANSTLGRWYCFRKSAWDRGLPLLAKGKDERLKALAQQELKSPTNAEQLVQLAAAWWEQAQTQPTPLRDGILARADDEYRRALPHLTSALTKAAVNNRLAEIGKLRAAAALSMRASAKTITNSIGLKLMLIPAGEFVMGSPETERQRRPDERQHQVRITKPFYLGVYPVTQAEYERVLEANPSRFSTANSHGASAGQDTSRFPVDSVSAVRAEEFCRSLSALPREQSAGRSYRLPTEAEWEYACRAGTTTPFYCGLTLSLRQANFTGRDHDVLIQGGVESAMSGGLQRTTVVGSYPPNALGLYDMLGNVNQLCHDWEDKTYYDHSPVDDPQGPTSGQFRVVRGGSWADPASDCRAACRRHQIDKMTSSPMVGFRVVCERSDADTKSTAP